MRFRLFGRRSPRRCANEDGREVSTSLDIVVVEHNEITATGREAGCLAINFFGPDPYVANITTVGVVTRVMMK